MTLNLFKKIILNIHYVQIINRNLPKRKIFM